MSKKELYRGEIIAKAFRKEITKQAASEQIGIGLRQVKRIVKKYKQGGPAGLAHGNRGKSSNKKISSSIRTRILELIRHNYLDFGPKLISEQLEERHKIKVSSEWIRILMLEEGLWQAKKRKNGKYYQRRTRRPREGELLQIDGSPEYWFEDRRGKCTLINMVDDATGKIMELRFVEQECLDGYFQSMKHYICKFGRPLAVYSDRHTIFKSPKEDGKLRLSQFGRAMKELDIELIHANSPQAKGRVERSHGTLQDRLIKLMRIEGIDTIEDGNRYLERFREDYNHRFGRMPQCVKNAHRELPNDVDLEKILCRKEHRKISKSLEVSYKHKIYQIRGQENSRRLVGKTVQVVEHVKGVIIEFDGEEFDYQLYSEQPYQECVMDRKRIDAFLDRKKPMSMIERHRKKKLVNF